MVKANLLVSFILALVVHGYAHLAFSVDYLYVSLNDSNGNVVRFDVSSNDSSVIASSRTSILNTFENGAFGLAFDSNSNLYVSRNNNTISKLDPKLNISVLADCGDFYRNIATDNAGNIYVSNGWGGDKVLKIYPDGQVTTLATGLNQPMGLAFGPDGYLYCAIMGDQSVVKISPTGAVSPFVSVTGNVNFGYGPYGITFDQGGNLFVGIYGAPVIHKYLPDGTDIVFANLKPESIYDAGIGLMGLAFDSEGYLYAANGAGLSVSKFDHNGNVILNFSTGGLYPRFLAFAPNPISVPETSSCIYTLVSLFVFLGRKSRSIFKK